MAATDSISIHNQLPGAIEARPLTILVLFPSQLLTDNRPHGDGRLAWGYIRALAGRGHTLHVAARNVDFVEPPPPNVFVYSFSCTRSSETLLERLRFMRSVRSLIRKLHTVSTSYTNSILYIAESVSACSISMFRWCWGLFPQRGRRIRALV